MTQRADHPGRGPAAGDGAAEQLFAELSRVERAPEALTGRVMGRVGYRPVSGREWTRRWWRRTSVRLATAGLVVGVLAAAALVLHERDGRHPDPVAVEAAVVQDVEAARGRVAAALAGLRQFVPAPAAMPSAIATGAAEPAGAVNPVEAVEMPEAEAEVDVEPAVHAPAPRTAEPVQAPAPGLGPAGFPSGGRAIDRLWSPRLDPRPGAPAAGSEQAELGPLTGRDPAAGSRVAGPWRLPT